MTWLLSDEDQDAFFCITGRVSVPSFSMTVRLLTLPQGWQRKIYVDELYLIPPNGHTRS
jgi:hypothetical protein